MSPRGAWDAKTRREKLWGTDTTSDATIAGLFHADPAKALVMTDVRRLVVELGPAGERRYSAKLSNR
jgi:hypothetical protein